MTTYKLYKTPNNKNAIAGQLDSGKTVSFEVDENNTDYQAYLEVAGRG
jgi:hypothetical protein